MHPSARANGPRDQSSGRARVRRHGHEELVFVPSFPSTSRNNMAPSSHSHYLELGSARAAPSEYLIISFPPMKGRSTSGTMTPSSVW